MKEKDFLRLVRLTDRRFFTEAAAYAETVQREKEETAMKSKKHKKIFVIAALAAALTAGGVTAGVAMRGHLTVRQEDSLTEKEKYTEVTAIGLHLTNAASLPASPRNPWGANYAESDTGWYYTKSTQNGGILTYTDKATGKSVPLCANPQCMHDGNLNCPATTKAYSSGLWYWTDGALLKITQKNPHPERTDGLIDYSGSHAVVLQYAADGSSIREAADLGIGSAGTSVLHRGCLFAFVKRQIGDSVKVYNDIKREDEELITAGYELIAYDITAGKTVTLLSQLPETGSGIEYTLPNAFWGIGDYVYFYYNTVKWRDPYKAGLYRVSLQNGQTETVIGDEQAFVRSISRTEVLYSKPDPDNITQTAYFLKNLETGAEQRLEHLTVSSFSGTIGDLEQMDENYICGGFYEPDKETCFIRIYDHTGNLSASVPLPKNQYLCSFRVDGERLLAKMAGTVTTKNGSMYMEQNTNEYLYSCSIKDALAGTAAWKREFCSDNTKEPEADLSAETQPANPELKPLGLNLTDDTCALGSPFRTDNYKYTESESGWYFRKVADRNLWSTGDWISTDHLNAGNYRNMANQNILWYHDKETGAELPLCANPGCKHDGNLYCPASTCAYNAFAPIWENDGLWAVAQKAGKPDSDPEKSDFTHAHTVILQIAPDGSSIKELADLGESTECSDAVYYRGCLFFAVGRQIGDSVEVENDITHNKEVLVTRGYDIYAYDLTAEKAVLIRSEMPEAGSNISYTLPDRFFGAGDYIYICFWKNSWQDPYQNGYYRISLKTGMTEKVLPEEKHVTAFSFSGNELLYTTENTQKQKNELHILNPDTKEDRIQEQWDANAHSVEAMDEHYYYGKYYDYETENAMITVYDRTFSLLGSLALPDHLESSQLRITDGRITVRVGNVTLSTENGQIKHDYTPEKGQRVLSCSLQDVLNGKGEWKVEFWLEKPDSAAE